MSRKFNITIVALSALVLLIAPFIPHHHHESVACVVSEFCANDNVYNDEHTSHNESSNDSDSNASCIENAQYILSNVGVSSNFEANFTLRNLAPFFISQYNFLLTPDVDVRVAMTYGEYIFIYKSAEITESNGLRAPPSIHA